MSMYVLCIRSLAIDRIRFKYLPYRFPIPWDSDARVQRYRTVGKAVNMCEEQPSQSQGTTWELGKALLDRTLAWGRMGAHVVIDLTGSAIRRALSTCLFA